MASQKACLLLCVLAISAVLVCGRNSLSSRNAASEVLQSATPQGMGMSEWGSPQRRLLEFVLGGNTLTATSTTSADICVNTMSSVDLNEGLPTEVKDAIITSATANGGKVSAYITQVKSTEGKSVSVETEIGVVAVAHAVTSTSLDGCKVKCPRRRGYAVNQKRPTASCMDRELYICPLASRSGYVVANALAMGKVLARGVAIAGVDSHGDPSAVAATNVSVFTKTPTGLSFAQAEGVANAGAVADAFYLTAAVSTYACVNVTATAVATVDTPQLNGCVIDCGKKYMGRLKRGDAPPRKGRRYGGRTSAFAGSNCLRRYVKQCFS